MTYQVLARKWRPKSFAEMAGQSHVLKTLINSLDNDRLHHAYLFTGTRGVGKTTIARILAKCLNCEKGVSSTPCGECGSCNEINEGRFIDLIEVDAASRTKVEDTRELLDNVQYAPTRGRYKVYLIDEVHMLSGHSFNALLKTLEEPPPHVKFLLATTDPQKLPVTVLSRCLQFNLKNLSPEQLVEHLTHILKSEDLAYEEAALWQLGRAARGSVRDSLTLLDQAIAFCDQNITDHDVRELLGTIDQSVIQKLLTALAENKAADLLAIVNDVAEHAPDFSAILQDLVSYMHRVAIAQVIPNAIDNSQGNKAAILQHAQAIPAENLQLYYQIGLKARDEMALAIDARSGLEMALLRMLAFTPQGVPSQPQTTLAQDSSLDSESEQKKKPESSINREIPQVPEPVVDVSNSSNSAPSSVTQQTPVEHDLALTAVAPPWETDTQDVVPVASEPETTSPARVEEMVIQPMRVEESGGEKSKSAEVKGTNSFEATSGNQVKDDGNGKEPLSQKPTSEPLKHVTAPVVKQARNEKSDTTPAQAEKVALSTMNTADWIVVFYQLEISGITRNIAANGVLTKVEGNHVNMVLQEAQAAVYNDQHKKKLESALCDYFSTPIKLSVELAETLPIDEESPAVWRKRQEQERHQLAVTTFEQDANVKAIVENFSGSIVADSIEPLSPKNY